jgi:hypothetical protein
MSRQSKTCQGVTIHLSTAHGIVFCGTAEGVTLSTAAGTIEVMAEGESYLSMIGAADLQIRLGDVTRVFHFKNANASLKRGRLSVLAETVREIVSQIA